MKAEIRANEVNGIPLTPAQLILITWQKTARVLADDEATYATKQERKHR